MKSHKHFFSVSQIRDSCLYNERYCVTFVTTVRARCSACHEFVTIVPEGLTTYEQLDLFA